PSIIVNEDTTITNSDHIKLRDRSEWLTHDIVKDVNWLRNKINTSEKHKNTKLLAPAITEINISIAKLNQKYQTSIEYVNDTWTESWLENVKKGYSKINWHLKRENQKAEEFQI